MLFKLNLCILMYNLVSSNGSKVVKFYICGKMTPMWMQK